MDNGQYGRNGRYGQNIRADEPLIPRHGGYRKLKSFQIAQLVYDVTVRFCDRYIDKRSRTHDQMEQAARSGVQNIAEGSQASGTSRKMELKLTNVARSSLEELRLDYEDFLRQRRLGLWPREDPRRDSLVARRCATADEVARWVTEQARTLPDNPSALTCPSARPTSSARPAAPGRSIASTTSTTSTSSMSSIFAELSANAVLVLIGVAVSLLDRQIAAQAAAFEREGGFTERLYRTRQARRKKDLEG